MKNVSEVMSAEPMRRFNLKLLWCTLLVITITLMITGELILRPGYMHIYKMLIGTEVDTIDNISWEPPPFHHRNYNGLVHDKWIVADYTSSDCSETLFASPHEWRWIVIGGNRPLNDCKEPRCIVIDPEARISKRMPPEGKRLWWLNKAYLTAISRGAVQILDVDCRMTSTNALDVLKFDDSDFTGLMYNSTRHFNPYHHFGAWSVTTGLSERDKDASGILPLSYIRNLSRVLVLHGLSDLSEDHQLSKKYDGDLNGLRFNPFAPPVFTAQATFSPTASLCTLYRQEALWGLLLPCFSQPVRCSVIRHYITQRLLWELDGFTGFYQIQAAFRRPVVGQSPAAKIIDILANNTEMDRLAMYLEKWVCEPEMTFFSCLETLALDVVANGTLQQVDVAQVQNWVAAFRAAGLREPARALKAWRGVPKVSDVRVVLGADLRTVTEAEGSRTLTYLQRDLVDNFTASCGDDSAKFMSPVTHWSQPVFDDIVLIVEFNENKYFFTNLPYLEAIHRPFFRHIIYCVSNLRDLLDDNRRHLLNHVTLLEAFSDSWYLKYECVTHVAAMNIPGVKGYLQIGDDTLLNSWMLQNMSRDSMWIGRGVEIRHAHAVHAWSWWHSSNGRPAVLRALGELELISGMTSQQILNLDPNSTASSSVRELTFSDLYRNMSQTYNSLMKKPLPGSELWRPPSGEEARNFLENYYREHHMTGKLAVQTTDFFYVPQKLISTYVTFSRFFLKYKAMTELVVATMHYGIARKSEINHVNVRFLWGGDRGRVPEIYNNHSLIAVHPFKVVRSIREEKGRRFFCRQYLEDLFSKRAELSREKLRHTVS